MFRLLATATTLALCTACEIPLLILAVDALDDPDPVIREASAEGQMRGDLPETGTFDRAITEAWVERWEGGIDLDVHSTDGDWAMLGGSVDVDLQDGESVVLGPDEHYIIGCAGPEEFDARFDRPADEVSLSQQTVEIEGEWYVELTVHASFGEDGEATAVLVQPVAQPTPAD